MYMQVDEKKIGKQSNWMKKEKKKKATDVESTKCIWVFSPLNFLPILRRKLFGEPKEKTLGPHHLFSLSPPQPNTLNKVFSHFFSFLFHPL